MKNIAEETAALGIYLCFFPAAWESRAATPIFEMSISALQNKHLTLDLFFGTA